uniref:Uncharacterized protein n=1 Tax=Setaria italica TaxID=4555 RepID=K3Z1T5_SETIT
MLTTGRINNDRITSQLAPACTRTFLVTFFMENQRNDANHILIASARIMA